MSFQDDVSSAKDVDLDLTLDLKVNKKANLCHIFVLPVTFFKVLHCMKRIVSVTRKLCGNLTKQNIYMWFPFGNFKFTMVYRMQKLILNPRFPQVSTA